MKQFTQLFTAIDSTTKTNAKVDALLHYLHQAQEKDLLYTVALLTGNRPKRPVKTSLLKQWAAEEAGIPNWLFDDSYYIVGDLAETIALLLPDKVFNQDHPLHEVITNLQDMASMEDAEKRKVITAYWHTLEGNEMFVFNKLITGNFRMGVSSRLVIKALSKFLQSPETKIAHQLMGKWNPAEETWSTLFHEDVTTHKHYQPYPFYLAYPIESDVGELGSLEDWIIEPKLDGIRGQIIKRNGDLFVWSRGEDLLTDKFPEFDILKEVLPEGTVIDGEIIPFKEGHFLDFNKLQTRIGRKNLTKKILQEVPVVMVCFDLLEWNGADIRHYPLRERRQLLLDMLQSLPVSTPLKISEALPFNNWLEVGDYRVQARAYQTEGVMLKHQDSPYQTGRKRGHWWKWKTNPMTIDGVLIYAQSGHGRRANLFTDYTFAVWDEHQNLLPFAKAYSGLTDREIVELDRWIKQHTLEKFGPVRSVTPHHVFEIAFEGIAFSPRHKSGIALRFPRILRWRKDKKPQQANRIEDLKALIKR